MDEESPRFRSIGARHAVSTARPRSGNDPHPFRAARVSKRSSNGLRQPGLYVRKRPINIAIPGTAIAAPNASKKDSTLSA